MILLITVNLIITQSKVHHNVKAADNGCWFNDLYALIGNIVIQIKGAICYHQKYEVGPNKENLAHREKAHKEEKDSGPRKLNVFRGSGDSKVVTGKTEI